MRRGIKHLVAVHDRVILEIDLPPEVLYDLTIDGNSAVGDKNLAFPAGPKPGAGQSVRNSHRF